MTYDISDACMFFAGGHATCLAEWREPGVGWVVCTCRCHTEEQA